MRRRELRPISGAIGAVAVALALLGCGLGAGRTPTGVQMLVTRDFGAQQLHWVAGLKVQGQETVMSLLVRNYSVGTRFGGGFVQSIDGLPGGREAGQPVDWFYYVNGVEAEKGAAATNVHPGDHIWWDHHDWSQTEHIPAVVGSFPEPFLNGLAGKRLPVRVECATVAEYACRKVTERLRARGVPAATAALGSGGEPETLRVMVAPWTRIEGDPAAASILEGPRASGVYARFSRNGSSLRLLDRDGREVRTLLAGAGLVAATRHAQNAPVWLVTGTDGAGVDLAARAFDVGTLESRFAVALTQSVALPVPVSGIERQVTP